MMSKERLLLFKVSTFRIIQIRFGVIEGLRKNVVQFGMENVVLIIDNAAIHKTRNLQLEFTPVI